MIGLLVREAGVFARPLHFADNTEMNKQEIRKQLAALSFSEKVKILEKLRDRSQALSTSGLRPKLKTNEAKVNSALAEDRWRNSLRGFRQMPV